MRYVIDIDSPAFESALGLVDGALTQLMGHHNAVRIAYGRGSQQAIFAGRAVFAAELFLAALKKAQAEAEPEHSHGTYDGAAGALQAGDAMALVYGKPRNDPRTVTRRKNGNKRR